VTLPLQSNDITQVLGLQGYRLGDVERVADGYVVAVELPETAACPRCGTQTDTGHQRARRARRVLWGFLGGERRWVHLTRRRLRCRACRKVFTQPLPGVAPRQRVRVVAQRAILGALAEQSFAALRRAWGITYSRAQRLVLRLPVPWCDGRQVVGVDGPLTLGIDEHSFRGTDLVITITCLTTHQVLAILPKDRQASLRAARAAMPDEVRRRIVAVCIDLKSSFRSVRGALLPQAAVVADRFHVIADANKRLDATRRLEQSEAKSTLPRWPLLKRPATLTVKQEGQLAALLARFPTLAEHSWVKERLRALYRCTSRAAAEAHWHSTVVAMEASADAAVLVWARTLRAWRRQILAYFDQRITNGYTEGCHTKIKLLKRLSYGFRNVAVYIRKMLLGFLPRSPETLAPHLLT
jgi:transposase